MQRNNFVKMTLALTLALPTSIYFKIEVAQASSDNAQALQVVQAAIGIAQVSNLDFGTAIQGDIVKTVAPGAVESIDNASFAISGEANMAYTITLPANGLLDGAGAQSLYVGATRAALLATQIIGSYSDTFTIDVVY